MFVPNMLGGSPRLWKNGEWSELPITHKYTEPHRGIGVADMAHAIRDNRPHRANGELANHVLDLMFAFHDASNEGRHIELGTTCERPSALPEGDDVNAAVKQG